MAAADKAGRSNGIPWRDPVRIVELENARKGAPETAEAVTEKLERVKATLPEAKPLRYWEEIPLDPDVQDYIVQLCEQRGIDPAIVFAIIWRESSYDADAIGDDGNAVGLMQVQPRFHADRMARLGCDNLSNPLQNVTVGINYLAELIDRQKGLEWAVTAYNRGATGANRRGGTSEYAREVLAEAERMKHDVLT
jgi:soluble lytic murein transglycosylase-like protein